MKRRYVGAVLGTVVAVTSAVPRWRTELGARLIRATYLVDRANDRLEFVFTRLRIALVLAFATDEMLERYGQLGYRSMDRYRPDKSSFVDDLFAWEASVIERFFPDPPARLLIGGAGGAGSHLPWRKRDTTSSPSIPFPSLSTRRRSFRSG